MPGSLSPFLTGPLAQTASSNRWLVSLWLFCYIFFELLDFFLLTSSFLLITLPLPRSLIVCLFSCHKYFFFNKFKFFSLKYVQVSLLRYFVDHCQKKKLFSRCFIHMVHLFSLIIINIYISSQVKIHSIYSNLNKPERNKI